MLSILKKYTWENYLFFALLLLNTLPLFTSSNFVTLDGGAHAYNTNIISGLLFDKTSVYHDYYQFNPELVPNWFTHILLVIFKIVLPYSLAEKLLVLLYFILTPFFFRKTVLLMNPDNKTLTYVILPFVHFFMLYLGFFNFCYGILFCFAGIYYWTKTFGNNSFKKWAIMFLIGCLTYFSHIFPFVVLVMYSLSSVFFNYLREYGSSFKSLLSALFLAFLRPMLILLVLFIPLFLLLKNYFDKRPTFGKEIFLTHSDLARQVLGIKPLQVYGEQEFRFTRIIFIWFAIFAVAVGLIALWNYIRKKWSFRADYLKHNFVFLAAVLICLLLRVPDDDGYGGFISIRIILFIWYFLMFWLAVQRIKKSIQWIFVIGLLGVQAPLLMDRVQGVKWVCSEYKNIEGIENFIEPGSTVTQMYFDDANWLGHHFSNYIGAKKPIVVLDNYEASKEYFPLVWKDDYIPNMLIGKTSTFETCLYWKSNPYNPETKQVDYLLLIGEKPGDDCYEKTLKLIVENAVEVYRQGKVVLYKTKK
ncbi:MAG: hypothetical protein K0S33_1641 [Bacteroidetes bacterium]|jgi:hypothetical protein|nr:hypothetical protein [Bacteroidota bacterium]